MRHGIVLTLLLSACVGEIGDPDLAPDICRMNPLQPHYILGLGARSDTGRTIAMYEYVPKTSTWYYSCDAGVMTLTSQDLVEAWTIERALEDELQVSVTVTDHGDVRVEKLTIR